MAQLQKPCRVGDDVSDIETPALLVCLDRLEANIRKMQATMSQNYPGVAVRPHAKTHKSPGIARLQVREGAVGVCCQTVTEAEAMVEGGVNDVFVSNEMVSKSKLRRLGSLAKTAKISLAVDCCENLRDVSDVASDMGVNIDIVVELNVGGFRCGVESADSAVELARKAASLPGVTFKGIHAYNGVNQHVRSAAERSGGVKLVVDKVRHVLDALSGAGINCDYVTGAGTGTFKYEAGSKVFTEIQPGSYAVMDADYRRNLAEDGEFISEFQQSLFVLSTVQSTPEDGTRVVLDAGMKALSMDSGVPVLSDYPELTYYCGGDNHGIVSPPGDLKLGTKVWLIPGHCDPTINLYDWIVGIRKGKVECVWSISGRGPGL